MCVLSLTCINFLWCKLGVSLIAFKRVISLLINLCLTSYQFCLFLILMILSPQPGVLWKKKTEEGFPMFLKFFIGLKSSDFLSLVFIVCSIVFSSKRLKKMMMLLTTQQKWYFKFVRVLWICWNANNFWFSGALWTWCVLIKRRVLIAIINLFCKKKKKKKKKIIF